MSGKLCTGQAENNIGAGRLSQSKAFCEGRLANVNGGIIGDDPFLAGSPDSDAWIAGLADLAAANTTCCAV